MFYLPSTIISIIEVLLVIVPALLSVAYVTVAERKTMASMQRRLGPNQVGHISSTLTLHRNNLYVDYPFTNYINTFVVRRFHTSNYYLSNKNLLDSLLNSRLAPVIPFTHPVLITCDNFLNQTEKNEFFSKLSDLIIEKKDNDLGVIYIFQYKHDPNVYYIGRTNSLRTRLVNHLSKYKFDKFHIVSRNLGWENFSLSVIEINNSSKLIERENYYLCYYKPLLNTLFRSFYSADINKKIDLIDSVKDLKITENLSINIEEQTLINDTNYLEEDKENKDINQKPEKSIYPV
jgi:hypothetical protein